MVWGEGVKIATRSTGDMEITVGAGLNQLCSVETVKWLNYYKRYYLVIQTEKTMAPSEFDCIFEWVDATDIVISNDHDQDVGMKLLQKPDELAKLKALERLNFEVSAETFDQLKLCIFMENLEAIQVIGINHILLEEDQIETLELKQLPLLDGWTSLNLKDISVLTYAKPTAQISQDLVAPNSDKNVILQAIIDFARYLWGPFMRR